MKALQSAIVGILALVFAGSLSAQRKPDPSIVLSGPTCPWTTEVARDWVRSPIQMDIHAGYRIFVFESDGTVGYKVRGEFPHAAFLSFTIYTKLGVLHSALVDDRIQPDPGSVNPFHPNELVDAANRSYTVTVLPDGAVAGAMPNPIFVPPPLRNSNVVTAVLVQRVYLPEPKEDRFGGTNAIIEPFLVNNPTVPGTCPTGDYSETASHVGSSGVNFSQAPLPQNGTIAFYRPPADTVPFADGSSPLTNHDCTGYLMATVSPDRLAVIHLPSVPGFFDNTNIAKTTIFVEPDVRYISLGSYGASPLGVRENENVAGPDIKKLPDGSATFVAIPIEMSSSDRQAVIDRANALGYNVMPLARYGPLFPGVATGPDINPFLIYRNKVPKNGFAGDILNVPCFQGTSFGHAPWMYAASPANMDKYAPLGIECTISDFLYGSCGQSFHYLHP